MKYRLLVLPNQKSMRPEVLKKISELVRAGLAVYGGAPEYSPSLSGYPEVDKEVLRIGTELFANSHYGKGKVFHRGIAMQEVLDTLNIHPDFTCEKIFRFCLYIELCRMRKFILCPIRIMKKSFSTESSAFRRNCFRSFGIL